MKPLVIAVTAIALAGCAADGGMGSMNRPYMEPGIFIGAAGGALLGAAAYKQDRTKGAIIGAIGGGIAGGAVGAYMDSQRKDLEKNLDREIKSRQARVDKLQNNIVRVTMTSDTGFATNSADIRPGFNSTMDKIADVVKRYGKTTLTIAGHTDDVGSNQHNQGLSERRALSVARYFEGKGVQAVRLATVGKGETMPLESNSTEGGRAANRRVEIYVEPVVEGS
jgi:outer membrane protein OmpA-like peptidoglycan-associated protein